MIKKVLFAILVVLALGILVGHVSKVRADGRYFEAYDPTLPFNVNVREDIPLEGYRRITFDWESTPGEAVPTLLTFPTEFEGQLPCIVFLHGIGQKKNFLNEITVPFNEQGFAVACFDQYMQGERKLPPDTGLLAQAGAFRERASKTINETRRIIDYLGSRNDIDHERIYLVGASYGAITGSTAAAFDDRIKAAALIYGAGDLNKMLDASAIADEVGLFLPLAKMVVGYIMGPADPINYVHQIAPRPVLFQNGDHDILISNPAAEALHAAAGEPKKIIWYDSDHVGLDEANTLQVLEDCKAWIMEQDARVVAELKKARAETLANAV